MNLSGKNQRRGVWLEGVACQRLREVVSEIKKVAKKDPNAGAEGAVGLMEILWPALQHVEGDPLGE